MYKNNLEVMEFTKWNNKILKVYWLIALVAVITEIVIFLAVAIPRGDDRVPYFTTYVLEPTIINVALLSISELIYRLIKEKYKEITKYFIVIVGTVLAFNIICVHYSVNIIYVLFLLPIMLSVYYGSNKIAIFTLILNLILYILFVFLYLPTKPPEDYSHDLTEVFTTIASMFATEIIVRSFIRRSDEMSEVIITMYETERELTLKNFVMEINSKFEPLTGLYNHKTFYENLDNLINQSEDFKFPLSLAVMDIDNFKRVNDTYGHGFGDEIIKALAETIKDSIGTDGYAARYGGDEFAIIFPNKDRFKAFDAMEAIRVKFNNKKISNDNDVRFTISTGISEHKHGMPMKTFFSNADAALYISKRSGGNKTIIYEENE